MAKTETKRRNYIATVRVNLEIGYDISAVSLDDAYEQAKNLKIEDVVDMRGDNYESELVLKGIWLNGLNCREGLK